MRGQRRGEARHMTHDEYDTPFKIVEYCEPDLDEKLLSGVVYTGGGRQEKSRGVRCAGGELKGWVTSRGLPPGHLPYMGISVEDVLTELRPPRPTLVKS